METPSARSLRPRHIPTPKFGDRKKKLFSESIDNSPIKHSSPRNIINENDEDSDLGPMSPLECSSSPSSFKIKFGLSRAENDKSGRRTIFSGILAEDLDSLEKKFSLQKVTVNMGYKVDAKSMVKSTKPNENSESGAEDGVTPLCTSLENMSTLAIDSPSIGSTFNVFRGENYAQQMKTPSDSLITVDGKEPITRGQSFRKSLLLSAEYTPQDTDLSNTTKNDKENGGERPKARASLTFNEPMIPVKSFYGRSNVTADSIENVFKKKWAPSLPIMSMFNKIKSKSTHRKPKAKRSKGPTLWQCRGIAKPTNFNRINMKKKHKKIQSSSESTLETTGNSVELDSSVSAKKALTASEANMHTPITHKSLRKVLKDQNSFSPWESSRQSAIKACKKLDLNDVDESEQADDESEDDDENNDPLLNANLFSNVVKESKEVQEEESGTTRKFFKSKGDKTTKKYHIMNGFSATMKRPNDMKLEVPAKRVRRNKVLNKEISCIIDRLSSPSKSKPNEEETQHDKDRVDESVANETADVAIPVEPMSTELNVSEKTIEDYRCMIPYNTVDPQKISQQESILELLISNGICDDETFKIFIAEPDLHKERATEILDNLYCVNRLIPEEENGYEITSDAMETVGIGISTTAECQSAGAPVILVDESAAIQKTSYSASDSHLFPIFRSNFKEPQQKQDLSSHLSSVSSSMNSSKWKPIGDNQYQIDAGQKEFGLKQCGQCGMSYSVHEPEDEILHMKFHNYIEILSFKGWNDERVVCEVPEWGIGGRIIYVCETDKKIKKNRVKELLSVVDKDLGFSVTELQPRTLVYLGIAKNQVIGVSVVHPIQEAHRLARVDGIDCCTTAKFPAKCGISRIWSSPICRRFGVATKLIQTIRGHFIFGHYLSAEDLAFSSPTEAGKRLAMNIIGREDFLVYEN